MRPFNYKQRGVTTIEYAIGAIVLIVSTLAIFEICYNIYVVNVTEYALRETIRGTKTYQGQRTHRRYQQKFNAILTQDDTLWHFLLAKDKFELSAKYFKNYRNFIDDVAESTDADSPEYVLAEMTLTYHYTPMLSIIPREITDISRTMVLNLEHEGWPANEDH